MLVPILFFKFFEILCYVLGICLHLNIYQLIEQILMFLNVQWFASSSISMRVYNIIVISDNFTRHWRCFNSTKLPIHSPHVFIGKILILRWGKLLIAVKYFDSLAKVGANKDIVVNREHSKHLIRKMNHVLENIIFYNVNFVTSCQPNHSIFCDTCMLNFIIKFNFPL